MTALRAGAATDTGRVRQNNQDSYVVEDNLFVVADGVGGHRGGEVASLTAVEAVRASFHEHEQPTLAELIGAVLQANRAVWERAQADPELRGMGTTLTALALVVEDDEERLALVNVGDSRAYLLQQGELSQLTEDHSLVEELVREGRLTRQEAEVHPQRSLITRALGLEYEVEVDNWQLLPYAGDRLLLCSDGLTTELSDDRIASLLRRLADPQEAARELVNEAKAAGGRDNITVVVVDVVDDDDRAARASEAVGATDRPSIDSTSAVGSSDGEEGDGSRGEARAEARAAAAEPAAEREPRPRRLTWRVALFALLFLVVLAVAGGAIWWFGRNQYFVGADADKVAVFKGRPGGLLWLDPTLERRTKLCTCPPDLPPAR